MAWGDGTTVLDQRTQHTVERGCTRALTHQFDLHCMYWRPGGGRWVDGRESGRAARLALHRSGVAVGVFVYCLHALWIVGHGVCRLLYYLLGGRGTRHLVAHKSKTAKNLSEMSCLKVKTEM